MCIFIILYKIRRPSKAKKVTRTTQEVAPVKAVDASPKLTSGTRNTDAAADTVKEIAISADSAAVATPVVAVSSKHSRAKHTMQLRGRPKSLSIISPSSSPTNKPIPPPTPAPLSPILQLDGQYHTPTYPTHSPISPTISTNTSPTSPKTTPTSPTTPISPTSFKHFSYTNPTPTWLWPHWWYMHVYYTC